MSLGVHVDVGVLIQAGVTKNADKTPPRTRLHKWITMQEDLDLASKDRFVESMLKNVLTAWQ